MDVFSVFILLSPENFEYLISNELGGGLMMVIDAPILQTNRETTAVLDYVSDVVKQKRNEIIEERDVK